MHKTTTKFLSIVLLAISTQVSALQIPCGEPKEPAKPYEPNTLAVWQDCNDLTWHVRAYQGKVTGTIFLSDLATLFKDEFSGTKNAKLVLNNGRISATIEFDIDLPKPNVTREFSFAVPLYARMVLVTSPGTKASVRFGDFIDQSGIVNLINPPDVEMHRTKIKTK